MNLVIRSAVLLATLALGACAANSYCKGEQSYEKAPSVPPLKPVEGLALPDSPSALKVPPPPANPVAYGETVKDADGDEVVRCLDKPPDMPAPKPEAPSTPAPGPAPEAEKPKV